MNLRLGVAFAMLLTGATVSPALAAWPNVPAVNLPVCTAASNQISPKITSDGAHGAIVAWADNRSNGAFADIYAQHVLASGATLTLYDASGRRVRSLVRRVVGTP
jgi:hypothetical protein